MAQRIFKHRQRAVIRDLYQNLGWRRARLDHLLYLFINSANLQEQDLAEELAKPMSERRELAGELQRKNVPARRMLVLPYRVGHTKHKNLFTFQRRLVDFSKGGGAPLLSLRTAPWRCGPSEGSDGRCG